MGKIKLLSLFAVAITLMGCNLYENPSEVASVHTGIPFRDASIISNSVEKNGILVAGEIPDSDIQFKMFSETLNDNIIPVLITITNNSNKSVLFKGGALKSENGMKNPLPLKNVIESLQGHFWLTIRMIAGAPLGETMNEKQKRDEAVVINLYNKTMRPAIIAPNQTKNGYLFYDAEKVGLGKYEIILDFQKLTRVDYFDISVPIKDTR